MDDFYFEDSFNLRDERLYKLKQELKQDKQVNQLYFSVEKATPVFLRSTLKIWENLGVKLHDVNVFSSKNDLYLAKMKNYCKYISDEAVHRAVKTSPANITIQMSPRLFFYFLESPALYGLTVPCEATESRDVIFSKIKVSRYNKYATACFYNHEIGHTQNRFDYKSNASLNNEVIPMLFEELSALYLQRSGRLLREIRMMRLKNLSDNLTELHKRFGTLKYRDIREITGYIQSTLEEISLMNIYLAGNKEIKKEMIYFINKVISNEMSIEDMIDYYGCNVDEISTDLKTLKKTRFRSNY